MLDFGDGLLNLSAGSFDPAEGDELHQMVFSLETEATEFRIGFSEVQAERWAMAICEISKRVELLGRLQ